jgi:hypothetical protein
MKASISQHRAALARAEKAVHDDHRRLEQLVARLQAVTDPPALFSAAEVLRQALIAHFVHEEHPGGFYDSLKVAVPQHREELAQLMLEHHHITVAVWRLRHHARLPAARQENLRRELFQLVKKLQDHEKREDEMTREALGTGKAGRQKSRSA